MRDLRELEIDRFLAQAETLAQLSALPAWDQWTALLREMRNAAMEELITAKVDEVRYWQGVASALGEILDRPGRIIASAADYARAEEADKREFRPELRAVVGRGYDESSDVSM